MRKGDDLRERAFRFACHVVNLHDELWQRGGSGRVLTAQLLRSGSSIGANLEEAEAAQSRADFASKCGIALKEARESHYWLRLLRETRKIPPNTPLVDECNELVAIITTIVRKTRARA